MKLDYHRYEEIKYIIASTFKKGNIASVPIDCFQLAEALQIKCISYSSLPEEKQAACLEFSSEGFILDDSIYYNDLLLHKRIRFTIMHEIGHLILDHYDDDYGISDLEANFFAKYILVPPILVYAIDRLGDISEDKIRNIFDVSHPVAGYSYNYYNKWANHIKRKFGFPEIDITIYNHFYRAVAI